MWNNEWIKGVDYPEWGDNEVYKKTIGGGYLYNGETPKEAYERVIEPSNEKTKELNKENLTAVSKTLQSKKIKISCRDFEAVLGDAKKGDLVYFDPPYQPVSSTANFTSYTHRDLIEDDLERLADLGDQLNSKGCNVLLSNSNSKTVKDFFSKKHWKISSINANRAINSNAQKRTGHKEIIIKNY